VNATIRPFEGFRVDTVVTETEIVEVGADKQLLKEA
jgi:hypothetical protein